jgi:hypothetical protein
VGGGWAARTATGDLSLKKSTKRRNEKMREAHVRKRKRKMYGKSAKMCNKKKVDCGSKKMG